MIYEIDTAAAAALSTIEQGILSNPANFERLLPLNLTGSIDLGSVLSPSDGWNRLSYVIREQDVAIGRVILHLSACPRFVANVGIINYVVFDSEHEALARYFMPNVERVVDDALLIRRFSKIEWEAAVRHGLPDHSSFYRAWTKRVGGRVTGRRTNSGMLRNGEICDIESYEVMASSWEMYRCKLKS
jgi:hypothetical protein